MNVRRDWSTIRRDSQDQRHLLWNNHSSIWMWFQREVKAVKDDELRLYFQWQVSLEMPTWAGFCTAATSKKTRLHLSQKHNWIMWNEKSWNFKSMASLWIKRSLIRNSEPSKSTLGKIQTVGQWYNGCVHHNTSINHRSSGNLFDVCFTSSLPLPGFPLGWDHSLGEILICIKMGHSCWKKVAQSYFTPRWPYKTWSFLNVPHFLVVTQYMKLLF